ncbi:MAG: glycogen synthase, partial [Prevotella pallens]|nr:glycogen synthase [Prevotella pallens]
MSAVIPFYVKTAYKAEPQFAKSKVVTSLFTEQPRGSLGKKFKQCLEFKSAELSLIEKYGDNFDFKELGKLVIDYSDGIIQTSNNVNKELIQYAKDNKKEILLQPDNEEEVKTKYTEFYNKIIE